MSSEGLKVTCTVFIVSESQDGNARIR